MTPSPVVRGMLLGSLVAGLFTAPLSADEFAADRIYAGSGGNDRVLAYTVAGKLDSAVGGATALKDPGALAFGPDGQLYAASRSTGNIYAFSAFGPSGQLTATIGELVGLADPTAMVFTPNGTLLVADAESNTLIEIGLNGLLVSLFAGGAQLPGVRDLAYGPDGHLFVASAAAQGVIEFDPSGVQLRTLGLGEGLTDPASIAFDAAGRLFVSSGDADEIVVFARDGSVDERIALLGDLESPGGLAIASTGELVVVSRGTDDVLVLDAEGTLQQTLNSNFSEGWDVAISPYRFKFTTKGSLVVSGESRDKLKQTGQIALQPGGLQLMLELDPLEDEDGLERFGSRYLVMRGYELFEDQGQKKRLYTGSWISDAAAINGTGSLSLTISGKLDKKTGAYVVKKAAGNLLRASAEGVYVGTAKSGKLVK
ncbi:MAG: hypothetical protein DHS20C15_08860 [Planctomycetota bacterium]|nr:MAG: hypothetical protein DHS20C15_08860 [Planctomycetota bacterium]